MRDDDFVDAQIARWNVKRQLCRSIRVEKNLIPMIQNIALCARGRTDLLRDRFLLPPLPGEKHVASMVELAAFAIKEEKDIVLEHDNKVAKLFAVTLERIRIRPWPQKRPVAQMRQVLLGRGLPERFLNRHSHTRT